MTTAKHTHSFQSESEPTLSSISDYHKKMDSKKFSWIMLFMGAGLISAMVLYSVAGYLTN